MSIPPTGLIHAQRVCHTSAFESVAPPADFNPLTASAADLACHAIPPRPSDPQSLQVWNHLVGYFKHWEQIVQVEPPVASAPQSTTAPAFAQPAVTMPSTTSNAWSGYVLFAGQQSYAQPFSWNTSNAIWQQEAPFPGGTQYPYEEVANWAGVGGWGAQGTVGLVQAGTAMASNGGSPQWFWEVLPAAPVLAPSESACFLLLMPLLCEAALSQRRSWSPRMQFRRA